MGEVTSYLYSFSVHSGSSTIDRRSIKRKHIQFIHDLTVDTLCTNIITNKTNQKPCIVHAEPTKWNMPYSHQGKHCWSNTGLWCNAVTSYSLLPTFCSYTGLYVYTSLIACLCFVDGKTKRMIFTIVREKYRCLRCTHAITLQSNPFMDENETTCQSISLSLFWHHSRIE